MSDFPPGHMAFQARKFCIQNCFPEGNSTVAASANAKPVLRAALCNSSGATKVMSDARLPRDWYGDGDTNEIAACGSCKTVVKAAPGREFRFSVRNTDEISTYSNSNAAYVKSTGP